MSHARKRVPGPEKLAAHGTHECGNTHRPEFHFPLNQHSILISLGKI